ncbi:MAG: hypothetical protein IKV92_03255 [Akkermansia sp.]|nr:hypothetical protein [Akkermansia sp.]
MTANNSSNKANHEDCCPHSSSEQANISTAELEEYADSVRARIRLKNGEFFRNKDVRYTKVIVQEFLNAAQKTFYVFCGKLNQLVYEPLLANFVMAHSRGVNIKVITEASSDDIESPILAKWLDTIKSIRHFRKGEIPHFVLADGQMYRLEVDEGRKSALVCAYAENNPEALPTATAMDKVHQHLWKKSK